MTLHTLSASCLDTQVRVGAFQDAVAMMCQLEITPDDVAGFRSETAIGLVPGAILGRSMHSPCQVRRTAELAAAGSDNVMIHAPRSGAFRMHQRGGAEVICTPGQIYIDPNELDGNASFLDTGNEAFYISLPRSLVAGLRGVNDKLRQRIEVTPQWRLFLHYGELVMSELDGLSPGQAAQSARHLHDLALSAFGQGDPGPLPGTMAARLRVIRDDIEACLSQPDLTPGAIAARHGISERYLRMMFAADQTSFRAHVLERRLRRVHAALCSPDAAATTIAEIAGAAGFDDLSWFNNSYRRRFGQTPRDTRAEALFADPRRRQD